MKRECSKGIKRLTNREGVCASGRRGVAEGYGNFPGRNTEYSQRKLQMYAAIKMNGEDG